MASAAAQRYFNSFSTADQENIRRGWNGNDAMMDQWFQNAVAGGAVGPDGDPMRNQMNEANAAYNRGERGTTDTSGGFTAAQLRELAKQQNWSEDFDRYSDETIQGWINGWWDPAKQRFRSMRGAEGHFEKPTECPPGMMPGGPDENNPCINPNTGQSAPAAASGTGQTGSYWGQDDPLQRYLTNMMATGGGAFGGGSSNPYGGGAVQNGAQLQGGGVFWSNGQAPPAAAATAGTGQVDPSHGAGSSSAQGIMPTGPAQHGGINPAANTASQSSIMQMPGPAPFASNPAPAAPAQTWAAAPSPAPSPAAANPWGTSNTNDGDGLAALANPTKRRRQDARSSWF
jgi:hypothetical protein